MGGNDGRKESGLDKAGSEGTGVSLRLGLTVPQAAHSCHLILPLDSRTKVRSLSQGNSAQRRDCSDMDYLELVYVCVCVRTSSVCVHTSAVCVCLKACVS